MSNKNIQQFSHLFWFLDVKKLNEDEDKNLIIHQVLAYGTMGEIKKLIKIYGKETVRKEFLKPKPGLYYPNILELICFILDVEKLDKRKYLRNIHGPLHEGSRQQENKVF